MLHQPPPPSQSQSQPTSQSTHSIKIMSGAEENRHYLRAFIQTYRDMPVLWDTSLRDYTNREKRAEAYQRLVPIYHYLKRDATVEDVKKKINTLRTNYRKELKVVESALRSGNLHTPRCWTFQELDFLRNTEKFLAVNPTFKNEPSFSFSENSSSTAAFLEQQQHHHHHYAYRQTPNISEMFHKSFGHVQKVDPLPPPATPIAASLAMQQQQLQQQQQQQQQQQATHSSQGDFVAAKRARQTPPCNSNSNVAASAHNTDELLNIACEYLAGTYPEEESIARTWTHKLKRLPREQRLLAERFINEILFEAESNNLHRGSVQINNSFEPYVRFEEPPACHEQEQDKSQSPSVHTSSESTPKASAGQATAGGGGGAIATGSSSLNETSTNAGIRGEF